MRKPIRPFAVETRRAGRTPLGKPARIALPGEDEQPKAAAQPEWPPMPAQDDSYVAAMRAADAYFSRPAPEPPPTGEPETGGAAPQPGEPPRRILQSLNEDDHISRILAEQEEHRPRRGRRPRQGDDAAMRERRPIETPVSAGAPELALAHADYASSGDIPGYVRGEIYGRYARHDRPRPGEHWRKRGLKPLW